jgi:hypothetical protein
MCISKTVCWFLRQFVSQFVYRCLWLYIGLILYAGLSNCTVMSQAVLRYLKLCRCLRQYADDSYSVYDFELYVAVSSGTCAKLCGCHRLHWCLKLCLDDSDYMQVCQTVRVSNNTSTSQTICRCLRLYVV